MIEKADCDLQPYAQRLHAVHKRHVSELMGCLAEFCSQPDHPGSVIGAVHTAVAAARDWLGVLDEIALPGIIDGEERLLKEYKKAAVKSVSQDKMHKPLVEQREGLRVQIDALKNV